MSRSLLSVYSFVLAAILLTEALQQARAYQPIMTWAGRIHRSRVGRVSSSSSSSSSSVPSNQTSSSSSSFGIDLPSFEWSREQQQQQIARIPMSEEDLREIMTSDGSGDGDKAKSSFLPLDRPKDAENNKYFRMIEKLAPNEMLSKFSQTAPQNVQEAAKSTIMNILGSLPQYALDASLFTTSTKLANLMFQMQITGYMFKNAEYRMSLTRSLKGYPKLPTVAKVRSGNITMALTSSQESNALSYSTSLPPSGGVGSDVRFDGSITVQGPRGENIQVPAKEITDALLKEVEELRNELLLVRQAREVELRGNMLTYIQALPESDLSKLTSDMSQEVMDSIQLLVDALMSRLGINSRAPEMLLQQPMGALAQLCMWQLVVGYKLRELEALERGISMD